MIPAILHIVKCFSDKIVNILNTKKIGLSDFKVATQLLVESHIQFWVTCFQLWYLVGSARGSRTVVTRSYKSILIFYFVIKSKNYMNSSFC